MQASPIHFLLYDRSIGYLKGEQRSGHVCLIALYEGPSLSLPKIPPWPKQRLSLPFQFPWLDYLGSVFMKEETGITQMWICLFICLAIRAIHLEWARSLSGEYFLQYLRRFVARRGRPETIISDNAAK